MNLYSCDNFQWILKWTDVSHKKTGGNKGVRTNIRICLHFHSLNFYFIYYVYRYTRRKGITQMARKHIFFRRLTWTKTCAVWMAILHKIYQETELLFVFPNITNFWRNSCEVLWEQRQTLWYGRRDESWEHGSRVVWTISTFVYMYTPYKRLDALFHIFTNSKRGLSKFR